MKRNLLNSLSLLFIIAVFTLANVFIGSTLIDKYTELSNGVIAFISYTASAFLTFVFIYVVRKLGKVYVPSLKPEISKLNPRLIVAGFVMILAMNVVMNPIIGLIPREYIEVLDKYMNNGLWAMVVAVIVAPIFEEFIFRGVIQTNLIRSYGVIPGIIIGAIVFGLMHIIPQQMVSGVGVGLVLGSIYYMTSSLNTVVAIHFVNNGFAYLLFMMFSDTNQLENTFLGNSSVYVIVYAVSLIILILGAGAVVNKARKSKPKVKRRLAKISPEE